MTLLSDQLVSFDLGGPLPEQTTILEASAGTGKTYAIAALTSRYLAEGVVGLDQLMLITFGRNATDELRSRVRERLGETEHWLTTVLLAGEDTQAMAQVASSTTDPVFALLARGDRTVVAERHRRIARAIADFDAATIATTHEFCLQMLSGLGVLGDHEPDAVFVDSLTDLTAQVAGDCYLRLFAAADQPPPFSFTEATKIAEQVIEFGSGALVPLGAAESTEAALRLRFATEVRAELTARKDRARLFSYDDMLTRLQQTLADPRHGEAAADRLRSKYRVVLVDEFQDTDPVQWDILRRAFAGHSTLILIGDPKQAIYAFRGADVFSYLQAVSAAQHQATLDTNWRSDAALVQALDIFFGGAALGDSRIVVRPVTAHHEDRRLDGERAGCPIRLRVLPYRDDHLDSVTRLRPVITADLVSDISALISSATTLQGLNVGRPDLGQVGIEDDQRPRQVSPGDIAVLVRTNGRAEQIRSALAEAGIPAVVLGSGSVFDSPAAREWLTLLTALERPRQALVREAALTCFLGWDFTQLATASEDELAELVQTVKGWSKILISHGVAALLETITSRTRLSERVLSGAHGERLLTDLRHVAQALHAVMSGRRLGIPALIEWLRERMTEAQINALNERSRRLDSDGRAVHILTVHRSKGLQFPIVYLPDAWDRYVPRGPDQGQLLRLHEADPVTPGGHDEQLRRVLDVGGAHGPGRTERMTRWYREEAGEDLRLLYVAMTRAQCQVITWWAPSRNTPDSALQRLLFRSPRGKTPQPGEIPEPYYDVTADPTELDHLEAGLFSVETVGPRAMPMPLSINQSAPELATRSLVRAIDSQWRRTSYSALTAAVHGLESAGPAVGSEAETGTDDESMTTPLGAAGQPVPTHDHFADLSPMSELPSGTAFGTIVHTIFEHSDPGAGDLLTTLREAIAHELARLPAESFTSDTLAEALLPAWLTPLGPLAGNHRLCDIKAADRLAELDFEFPLLGGDQAEQRQLLLGDLAPLLRRHLSDDDPLRPYADQLEHPQLAAEPLRGYLNGSIDAVLRIVDDHQPRYLIVDYKTNWLGGFDGTPLTLGHYAPPLLARAMMQAHYPLQALLYSVALHRYLRWRQPGYHPQHHLGGVLYLFVRGMAGPDTPTVDDVPCGVFSWLPPADLVVELSDLLAGGV